MKKTKKIFIIILVVIFLSSFFAIPVHAIDPISTGLALASAMDAYGMYYGIGTVYDVQNSSGITTSFSGLWDEFSQYQSSSGDSYDYHSFYNNFDSQPSVKGFSHSSGKFAGFHIDAESAEIFDKFWNWLLTGPAEMVIVDNSFQWSPDPTTNTISPIQIYYGFNINGVAVKKSNLFTINTSSSSNPDRQYKPTTSYIDHLYAYRCTDNGVDRVILFTDIPSGSFLEYRFGRESTDVWSNYSLISQSYSYYTLNGETYRYYNAGGSNLIAYDGIPLAALVNGSYSPKDVLGLDDSFPLSIAQSISVKPYNDEDDITLPIVTAPDYVPTSVDIITNVPWDDSYDDEDEDETVIPPVPIPWAPEDVEPIIDDIIVAIIDDGLAIEDDPQPSDPDTPPPVPSEVFTPLLPVSPPSFNFNFSGIWHYVREWVSSLGAWFSLVFTVWGILPYAIVVPVYATAVVVIVLGVYKRFFM